MDEIPFPGTNRVSVLGRFRGTCFRTLLRFSGKLNWSQRRCGSSCFEYCDYSRSTEKAA